VKNVGFQTQRTFLSPHLETAIQIGAWQFSGNFVTLLDEWLHWNLLTGHPLLGDTGRWNDTFARRTHLAIFPKWWKMSKIFYLIALSIWNPSHFSIHLTNHMTVSSCDQLLFEFFCSFWAASLVSGVKLLQCLRTFLNRKGK
jgi:hypothetical protein